MEPEKTDDNLAANLSEHARVRERLKARYNLAGEYIGAPTVALILGLGRTTVHDQVKAKRFIIRHRLADRKPLFLIDDLVAWMVGSEVPSDQPPAAQPGRRPDASIASAPVFDKQVPAFKHDDAREAFLRVCEQRGISPHL